MAVPFVLLFTATQSSDGKTVTITDGSPWGVGVNNEGYVQSDFVREFVLTDYLGNLITTLTLADDELTATYTVPVKTNPWINIEFSAVGPVTLTKTQKYGFQRYFELAYIDQVKGNCGCGCIDDDEMCMVDDFYTVSTFALPVGDAVNWQDDINSAYKLIS